MGPGNPTSAGEPNLDWTPSIPSPQTTTGGRPAPLGPGRDYDPGVLPDPTGEDVLGTAADIAATAAFGFARPGKVWGMPTQVGPNTFLYRNLLPWNPPAQVNLTDYTIFDYENQRWMSMGSQWTADNYPDFFTPPAQAGPANGGSHGMGGAGRRSAKPVKPPPSKLSPGGQSEPTSGVQQYNAPGNYSIGSSWSKYYGVSP